MTEQSKHVVYSSYRSGDRVYITNAGGFINQVGMVVEGPNKNQMYLVQLDNRDMALWFKNTHLTLLTDEPIEGTGRFNIGDLVLDKAEPDTFGTGEVVKVRQEGISPIYVVKWGDNVSVDHCDGSDLILAPTCDDEPTKTDSIDHCGLCGDSISNEDGTLIGYWDDEKVHYNCSVAAHRVWQTENLATSKDMEAADLRRTLWSIEQCDFEGTSECRCGGACENCRDCNAGECVVDSPNRPGTSSLSVNNQTKKGNEMSNKKPTNEKNKNLACVNCGCQESTHPIDVCKKYQKPTEDLDGKVRTYISNGEKWMEPAECNPTCPENQVCDYCQNTQYTEIYLACTLEDDGSLFVYSGNTTREYLKVDYLNPQPEDFVLTLRIPSDKLESALPKRIKEVVLEL